MSCLPCGVAPPAPSMRRYTIIMNSRPHTSAALVAATLLALIFLAAPRSARSQGALAYRLTDLGVLNLANPYAVANAINDFGQIAGESAYPDGNSRAFRITPVTVAGQPVWLQDANGDGANDLMSLLGLPKGNYHYSLAQ